jgi:hypothetical protein
MRAAGASGGRAARWRQARISDRERTGSSRVGAALQFEGIATRTMSDTISAGGPTLFSVHCRSDHQPHPGRISPSQARRPSNAYPELDTHEQLANAVETWLRVEHGER